MNTYLKSLLMLLVSCAVYAQDTELSLYRPFGDASQTLVTGTQTMEGQCWQQSERIKREDAWRCMAGGVVFDPCFVKQYGEHKQAICSQSPWMNTGVLLTLSRPVDNSQHAALDMSRTYPWAVELIRGEKCQAVDGGGFFDGMPIHYQCDNQSQLIGHLQRCKGQWMMLQHAVNGKVETVSISRAWF